MKKFLYIIGLILNIPSLASEIDMNQLLKYQNSANSDSSQSYTISNTEQQEAFDIANNTSRSSIIGGVIQKSAENYFRGTAYPLQCEIKCRGSTIDVIKTPAYNEWDARIFIQHKNENERYCENSYFKVGYCSIYIN